MPSFLSVAERITAVFLQSDSSHHACFFGRHWVSDFLVVCLSAWMECGQWLRALGLCCPLPWVFPSLSRAYSCYLAEILRSLGVRDDHIILMVAECPACDPRNSLRGRVMADDEHQNLYDASTEIDYQGLEVDKRSILNHFYGSYDPPIPLQKRLLSGPNSTVVLFTTGHGGIGFAKVQDFEEIREEEWQKAIRSMKQRGGFGRMLWLADTCRAASLWEGMTPEEMQAMHVGVFGSSGRRESSYAFRQSAALGQAVVDGFSYFLDGWQTFDAMKAAMQRASIGSTPETGGDLLPSIAHYVVRTGQELRDARSYEFLRAANSLPPPV